MWVGTPDDVEVLGPQRLHRGLHVVRLAAGDHDARTGAGERGRGGQADAACAAGDDGHLAMQAEPRDRIGVAGGDRFVSGHGGSPGAVAWCLDSVRYTPPPGAQRLTPPHG